MEFWTKAAQLILSLSILVFLHELGHFIPARLFKTRVEKFYLFFNPWFSLVKKKIGETEWGIGWIPLGGYVKIAGMIDESMDKEQMSKPAQPWEFRSKPAWQRLIIMIGGVVVNVIVGIVIYIFVLFGWGEERINSNDIEHGLAVAPYMEQFGFESGDNIVTINGEQVWNTQDINLAILIRDQYDLGVRHKDGSEEVISLEDGIEFDLFKEGVMQPFSLRAKARSVNYPISTRGIKLISGDLSLEAGDQLLSVNGKSLEDIDDLSAINETCDVELVRGTDTLSLKIAGEKTEEFFVSFPAASAGIIANDSIVKINDKDIVFFDDITSELWRNKNKTVNLTIIRGDSTMVLPTKVNSKGTIGFASKDLSLVDEDDIYTQYFSFGESIGSGIGMGYQTLTDYIGQLKFIFTKKGASSVGGFGAIGNMFPAQWDWHRFWLTTALISIILAFMNILPIPALDGGHVLFLLYEMITGREPKQRVLEIAQMVGFFLLIGLVLYANGNDIYRYFFQ